MSRARPLPTYAWPRRGCGLEVPVRFTGFRIEHLRRVGWPAYRAASYINWCGHRQEIIPMPRADGSVLFVDVVGEAT